MTNAKQVAPELQRKVRDAYAGVMTAKGGVTRVGQLQVIGAIARAVVNAKSADEAEGSGARLLAVHAPTGLGKSLAYAIGAIPVALANGLKVVIGTGTVALQEQLIQKDLPLLAEHVPEMVVACMKGRGRYSCAVRMAQAIESDAGGPVVAEVARLLASFEQGSWSGDVDDLTEKPSAAAWALSTNDRAGCAARKCSEVGNCPYYVSKRAADRANVIVTNQDMVLADLRAGNVMLPRAADACYVIDEAHLLVDKAMASLASGHALSDAQSEVQRCSKLVGAIRKADPVGMCGALASEAMRRIEVMGGTLSEARMAVANEGTTTEARDKRRPVRFRGGKLPTWLASAAVACRDASNEAAKALTELGEALQGEDGDNLPTTARERMLSDVGQAAGRLDRIASVWRLMASDGDGGLPVVKWLELTGEERDIRVCASPLGVGQYLHDALWSKVAAAIHLSGTLATVGGLTPHLRDSGLDRTKGVQTLIVDSPFRYKEQGTLVVPKGVVNPKDREGHTQWLVDHIPAIVERTPAGEGMLVIFGSHAQLNEVEAGMPQWVRDALLSQSSLTKREVLTRHKAAIAAGKRSVIFGTLGYSEGVDLPGKECTVVVLSKLQFAVPTDPVSEELRDHLEAQGRSHFDEVAIPMAYRRLAQTTGRLLRTETDGGLIVVADPRLTGTNYGRAMLASLPPYQLSRELHG